MARDKNIKPVQSGRFEVRTTDEQIKLARLAAEMRGLSFAEFVRAAVERETAEALLDAPIEDVVRTAFQTGGRLALTPQQVSQLAARLGIKE